MNDGESDIKIGTVNSPWKLKLLYSNVISSQRNDFKKTEASNIFNIILLFRQSTKNNTGKLFISRLLIYF
jgi:hypothetical protein